MAIADIAIDMGTTVMRMQNNPVKPSFTDLHSHILPSVDDGSESVEMSLEMLSRQKENGIDRIVLTPHFYPSRESVDSYLRRRESAYKTLQSCWDEEIMPQLRLGAEVRFSPELAKIDLTCLTIGEGRYLLLELPNEGAIPLLEQIVDSILCRGIVPVFAHIERCDLFRQDPDQLLRFVRMGAFSQISSSALRGKADSFAIACLRKGLAHVISSDAHKPNDCVDFLSLKNHRDIVLRAEHFSRAIWDNAPLPAFPIAPVKIGLFGYR